MITPSNDPSMVTFHVPGWEGVAICPTMKALPLDIGLLLNEGILEALPALRSWLPPNLGNALGDATAEQLGAFLTAWADASDLNDDTTGPVTMHATDRKTGLTVAELTNFCQAAQHLADHPVRITIGWRSQIHTITASQEN